MDFLRDLNDRQKEAVLHTEGPLLIVAGAGAGKTKTLTYRILRLIRERHAAPDEILAITFTNKAAGEMRERVANLLGTEPRLKFPVNEGSVPFVSTFHALSAWLLRHEHAAADLPKHFVILDEDDTNALVKNAIERAGLDPKQFEPRRMKNAISRQKGEGITLADFATGIGNDYFPRMVAAVWQHYDKLLTEHKGVDFDDLLLKALLVLEKNPDIAKRYQDRWKFVHIDEYQDTSGVQYRMSKLLAGPAKNITVVGDADQSIYSWRGADMRNLFQFEKDYPERKVILLEENYRSTKTILDAANAVIAQNKVRTEKNLFTNRAGGEPIGLYAAYDETDEAAFVAERASELVTRGTKPEDIAVLYRMNFLSRAMEEAFLKLGIPYQVLGVKFFERKEVKDLLAYIRLGLNPDSIADLKRIVNAPPRGIGKVTVAKIAAGKRNELPAAMRAKVDGLYRLIEELGTIIHTEKPSRAIELAIKKTGLAETLKHGTDEDKERLANLFELVSVAQRYDGLPDGMETLLADAALASDQDSLGEKKNGVRLMTVHAAKGLEFRYVFVVGLEQGIFPSERIMSETLRDDEREEERRLFYVAITRAKEKLFLSYAGTRTVFGMRQVNIPSDFLIDIPDRLMEAETRRDPIIEV